MKVPRRVFRDVAPLREVEVAFDPAQAEALRHLLEQIDPADSGMSETAAYAARTLAAITRELDIPAAIPALERHLRACSWPPTLNVQRFHALEALGWAFALHGDYFNAFRYLKQCDAVAPSRAWHVAAMLDRAYFAQALHEQRWSHQELLEAGEAAESVDWQSTRDEERAGLVRMAELFAPIDPGKAAKLLGEYRLHPSGSPLPRALACYSAGVAQLAWGERKPAIIALRESLEMFERGQYDWRAGRSALRLYEATGESGYLRLATERLRCYPHSWLADELRNVQATSNLPALPRMQQRVFERLCQGLSTAQIAGQLQRSEYTVKNHIKSIFKAFGVKRRAELLAKIASQR